MSEIAVITGASRGIGRATATRLSDLGFRVLLLGRSSEAMTSAVRELQEAGREAAHYEVDLADIAAVGRVGDLLVEREGAPEVLVHNAGIIERASFCELQEEAWTRQLTVNLTAPFVLTQRLLPAMLAAKRGRVIFISSISANLGSKYQAAYNASKAGEVALMRCLAEELTDTGLMTAAILPGAVATDMLKASPWPARMSAEEVAKTIGFLARDASLSHNGGVFEMFGI